MLLLRSNGLLINGCPFSPAGSGSDTWTITFIQADKSLISTKLLTVFSWKLGVCIPATILGPSGYLNRRQRDVQDLSLFTDFTCTNETDVELSMAISHFTLLRSFSWGGLRSEEDFQALAVCLENNQNSLESLVIDASDWIDSDCKWSSNFQDWNGDGSENYLAIEILSLEHGDRKVLFPALRKLSLLGIPLEGMLQETASALNFNILTHLRLWNCLRFYEPLITTSSFDQASNLECLELTVEEDQCIFKLEDLETTLEKIQGLQELYLLLPADAVWNVGWLQSVSTHTSTLRHLVLHERGPSETEDTDTMFYDSNIEWSPKLDNILRGANLECFGVSLEPDNLVCSISYIG